LNRQLS
jgi:pilus assembly protein Flp/PilA